MSPSPLFPLIEQLDRTKHPQGVVGLDQVDAVADRSLVVFHSLVRAQRIGKYFDSFGMATVDQILGKDRPVGVERIRLYPLGHGIEACRGS